jgi:hypothetical protein
MGEFFIKGIDAILWRRKNGSAKVSRGGCEPE